MATMVAWDRDSSTPTNDPCETPTSCNLEASSQPRSHSCEYVRVVVASWIAIACGVAFTWRCTYS